MTQTPLDLKYVATCVFLDLQDSMRYMTRFDRGANAVLRALAAELGEVLEYPQRLPTTDALPPSDLQTLTVRAAAHLRYRLIAGRHGTKHPGWKTLDELARLLKTQEAA